MYSLRNLEINKAFSEREVPGMLRNLRNSEEEEEGLMALSTPLGMGRLE